MAWHTFLTMILSYYERNGYKELATSNLPTFIDIKYKSTMDAIRMLGMNVTQLKGMYEDMQVQLYNGMTNYMKI